MAEFQQSLVKIPVNFGNSLVVQWLELQALTAEGLGSIPGRGTKIPQAVWHGQKKKKKNSWKFDNEPSWANMNQLQHCTVCHPALMNRTRILSALLAGRFLTAEPPGNPCGRSFNVFDYETLLQFLLGAFYICWVFTVFLFKIWNILNPETQLFSKKRLWICICRQFLALTSANINIYQYFRNWIFISVLPRGPCFCPIYFSKFWLSASIAAQGVAAQGHGLLMSVLPLYSISKSNYIFCGEESLLSGSAL